MKTNQSFNSVKNNQASTEDLINNHDVVNSSREQEPTDHQLVRNSIGELAASAFTSFSNFFKSTNEVTKSASWNRQRTKNELASFVTGRLAALEAVTLED